MKFNRWMMASLLGGMLLLIAGCEKEKTREIGGEPGSPIMFSAATSYKNGDDTRTDYSGDVLQESSQDIERIDWVEDDQITVNYAYTGGSDSKNFVVVSETESSYKSLAEVVELTDALYWADGSSHTFYAMYPTKAKNSNASLTGNHFEGSLPATQNPRTKNGSMEMQSVTVNNKTWNRYMPDMSYAYMLAYAGAGTTPTTISGNSVTLYFRPAVTTFEFRLRQVAGQDVAKVTQLQLISANHALTGSYNIDIAGGNKRGATWNTLVEGPNYPAKTSSNNVITVNFGSQGVALPSSNENKYLDVTVFALPIDLNDLTLKLVFADGTKREMPLKDKNSDGSFGNFHTFSGADKHVITNSDVPGSWEYKFGELSDVTVTYRGGSGNFATSSFVSYKQTGSVTKALSFTLQYSEDGTHWSNTPPSWLSSTGMNKNGGTTGQSFSATAEPQVNTGEDPHHEELVKSARARTNFDLSTYNVATTTWANNTTSTISRTTANCYVVQGSGTYRIPLVYGNGVKGGTANQDSYHGRNGVSGSYRDSDGGNYLAWFKDHLDQNITQPYIATQQSGKTLTAELLWVDEPGLVSNVGITGSGENAYLTFTVPSKYITQGNALVAVKANGVIAWSWHIWVTEDDLTVAKAGSASYSFPTVNIGWCEGKTRVWEERVCYVIATQAESGKTATATFTQTAETYTTKGNNPYYQWGRKDPMWASNGDRAGSATDSWSSLVYPKRYYPTSDEYAFPEGNGARPDFQLSVVERVSIGKAIQTPTKYYSSPETKTDGTGNPIHPVDWNSTVYVNKWSSTINGTPTHQTSDRHAQDANGKTKTIYDPSPVGFRVPTPDAWGGFTTSNFSWTSSGGSTGSEPGRSYSGGLFFPAAGNHFDWSGAIHFVRRNGYYWTTIPYADDYDNNDNGVRMYFSDSSVYPIDNASRSTAHAVRPVRE